jgi:hypothetical protein
MAHQEAVPGTSDDRPRLGLGRIVMSKHTISRNQLRKLMLDELRRRGCGVSALQIRALVGRNSYPANWNVVRFESRDDDDFTEVEKLVAEVCREFQNRFEVKTAA